MEDQHNTPNSSKLVNDNNKLNHRHNRKKKRKECSSPSLPTKTYHRPSIIITDTTLNSQTIYLAERKEQNDHVPIKHPLAWTKRWTKWFSSCSSEHVSQSNLNTIRVVTKKRARTKSETDVSKRGSIEQDEKKNLPTTVSNFAITNQNSNENSQERRLSRKISQQFHHHQSSDKVNNSNPIIHRDYTRRYSTSFFTSARYGGPRQSISVIPITTHQKQPLTSTHSIDRLHKKSHHRRELRYEEHNDYIPPPPLQSIQCHPTIEHYKKSLNQLPNHHHHRRSQIDTSHNLSSNLRHSHTIPNMSKTSADNNNKNNTYGKLSDCHTPLTPLENSSVKAPRRIESAYSQFPVQQEPVYANTQSLYDNILYPQSTTTTTTTGGGVGTVTTSKYSREKKSCASQTQLTWTMATFSSFVDLENQSAIIPQPDPSTLYSIVQHYRTEPPPSASPETIEQMKRLSPLLRNYEDTNPSSHYQRPRSPLQISVEKRDGSFQTLLSIAPTQDFESNKQLLLHDSTPSPTTSSATPGLAAAGQQRHHHHHHHHHRKHKSRNTSSSNVSTRDVGLQVNIQTVKKITILSQKSDESSLATTTTASPPPTLPTFRELKNVETNTEPLITKRDRSTSYESSVHLVTSSSQTTDSSSPPTTISISTNRETKAAQTPSKTLRDQASETNNLGLFVCDLSSLLKNGSDELTTISTKRKS